MPFELVCDRCNHVLLRRERDLRPRSPGDVPRLRCPECRAVLDWDTFALEVVWLGPQLEQLEAAPITN